MEYTLTGLSFREYLKFEGIKDIPVIELKDLLKKHKSSLKSLQLKLPRLLKNSKLVLRK